MKNISAIPASQKAIILFVTVFILCLSPMLKAANYYWVGNSGNWDDFANHWATTGGGAVFHTQPPTQTDDVNFDFNSFTAPGCTITFTNPAECLNFYGFPNFNPSMPLAGGPVPHLTVFGSFICPLPFDIQFPLSFFNMSPGTFDIQTGMNQFAIQIYTPNGPSTYNLLSDFIGCLSVASAKLNTNNYNIALSCNGFYIGQNAEVNFGTSTATNSALGLPELCGLTIDNTSTVNASQATINVTGDFIHTAGGTPLNIKSLTAGNIKCVGDTIGNATVTADYFNGGQNVINKLSFTNTNYPVLTDSLTSVSDNTIDTLEFTGNGIIDPFSGNRNYIIHVITSSGAEIKFGSGDTTYISAFGNYANPLTLSSSQAGQPSFLKFSGGQCFNSVSLQDINASGVGSFYAGSAGVDLGGNTGWQFASCTAVNAYYWVGGTGNWSDVSHWATASGGTTMHTLPPSLADDVFFDTNSGLSAFDTIYFNLTPSSCLNFNCSQGLNSLVFDGGIKVYSNLNILSSVIFNDVISLYGSSSTITTSNSLIDGIDIVAGASYSMNDDFKGEGFSSSGKLISNNHTINTPSINFLHCECYLGASQINAETMGGAPSIKFGDSCYVENVSINFYSDPSSGARIEFHSLATMDTIIVANINVFKTQGMSTSNVNFDIYIDGPSDIRRITVDDSIDVKFNMIPTFCKVGKLAIQEDLYVGNVGGGPPTVSLQIDTLFISKPGKSIMLPSGRIDINNELFSVYQLGIFSNITGGTINKSSGTICLKNYNILNNTATGGAQFFADNSINSGGNIGWQFAPCSIVSDVWPGDANYDLTVNNFDILNLGLAYNEIGPVRSGASLTYVAQPATDWNGYFQTAVNKKHADTNGDGIVDDNDTTAVSLNYGLTHPARMGNTQLAASPSDPYLYLSVNPDSANLSDTVYIETFFGTSQTPVDSVYGLAFTINYDTTLVDTSWISTQFLNSWFGQPGIDLLTFSKSIPLEQKIDVAIVRTDHNNTTGFGGPLCRTGIVIVDNVAGRMPLPITLSNARALTASEYELGINIGGDTVSVDTTTTGIVQHSDPTVAIKLFPNPAKNKLYVVTNSNSVYNYQLLDMFGNIILSNKGAVPQKTFSISSPGKGMYILQLLTSNGMVARKVVFME